jgi:hypothetical protein
VVVEALFFALGNGWLSAANGLSLFVLGLSATAAILIYLWLAPLYVAWRDRRWRRSAPEIPADVEAVYHELLERLGPAECAELARLLLDDGAPWADYYLETRLVIDENPQQTAQRKAMTR